MKSVFVDSCNIISPLGNTAFENYSQVREGISGVKIHHRPDIDQEPAWAALIDDVKIEEILQGTNTNGYSRYEKLILASITEALTHSDVDATDSSTAFIFSTTKGNISLLESDAGSEQVNLHLSAEKITSYFGNKNQPVVISNACISGVVALIYARRILGEGDFKNAIVTGADCINRFIYSGFLSFQALSNGNCHPFSESRDGINLGEGAATIILSTEKKNNNSTSIQILGGAITNDANHISGPSRTGEELFAAMEKAIKISGVKKSDIGFISAHGTATSFNDEMEAKAINLAGMQQTPVNSLKGYFGHTLGAAGLVESVIGLIALSNNEIIATAGYKAPCLQPSVNVNTKLEKNTMKNHFLKTASGFGGCNAALIFSKS